jgi:Protein of unknown function (DUF3563)
MLNFFKLFKALLPSTQSQRERDEAYLAEAMDIDDLERRLREIDARGRHTSDVAFGLGLW